MDGFTSTQMFLFLIVMLPLTASIERRSLTVGNGTTQTLTCVKVKQDEVDCKDVTWLFSSGNSTTSLFEHGQVKDGRSDRLRVTQNCSLVLKEVAVEDAGFYTCRHFIGPEHEQGEDTMVHLSVITKPLGRTSELKPTENNPPNPPGGGLNPTTENNPPNPPGGQSWWSVGVAAGGAGLLVTVVVVVVVRWKRTGESESRLYENVGLGSRPAGTGSGPETSQNSVRPPPPPLNHTRKVEPVLWGQENLYVNVGTGASFTEPVYINTHSGPVTSSSSSGWKVLNL